MFNREKKVSSLDNPEWCKQCLETGVPPAICKFFLNHISDISAKAAEAAVTNLLSHPIEMTVADIEAAFGHKIKIVD